jgi:hypothetical protein
MPVAIRKIVGTVCRPLLFYEDIVGDNGVIFENTKFEYILRNPSLDKIQK